MIEMNPQQELLARLDRLQSEIVAIGSMEGGMRINKVICDGCDQEVVSQNPNVVTNSHVRIQMDQIHGRSSVNLSGDMDLCTDCNLKLTDFIRRHIKEWLEDKEPKPANARGLRLEIGSRE